MDPEREFPLVLGTAQLGMPYGIGNKDGQPDQERANDIIMEAWERGIRQFDTAQGYGVSEHVLGKAFNRLGYSEEALVISKFDPNVDHLDAKAMIQALNKSLERLRVPALFGMMLHREDMLSLWNNGLGKILKGFVASGKVKHTGVSLYSPHKALDALDMEDIDMLQVPVNILDRRFEKAGVFELAVERTKRVYLRSVFLQGLILMGSEKIPEQMRFTRPVIEEIEALAHQMGLERDELALGYIRQKMPRAFVIFGAESPEQVRRSIECWEKNVQQDIVSSVEERFTNVEQVIIRPDLWPQ
jgi:aryl-alcohol dehydrogenase-like predicted oxidoreductase